MKKLTIILATLILSLSMCLAACDEAPSDSGTPSGGSGTLVDDTISAVVEDAPDYEIPTIYNLSGSYVMPKLTDEEMKEVVFTLSEKHYFATEPIPDLLDRSHEDGRVYLYEQPGYNAEPSDYYYIIDGITTDIETSDEYNKYKIRYNNAFQASFFHRQDPINNAYWQQYFDVMFDNVVFSEEKLHTESIDTELHSYDADLWTWVLGEGVTYYFYADGTLRKSSAGILYVADKKVDSPKVVMLSVLFRVLSEDGSSNGVNGLNNVDDVTFYYRGKTATVAFEEIPKLLQGDNRNVKFVNYADNSQCTFDIEYYYNEEHLTEGDLVYTTNQYGESYAIDIEGNVYSIRYRQGNELDGTDHHILGYFMSAISKQCAVYDYERLISLFE